MKRFIFLFLFAVFIFSCRKPKENVPGVAVVVNYNIAKLSDSSSNSGVIFLDLEHNVEADSFRIPGFALSTAIYSEYYNGFGYLDINNVYHITDLSGSDKITVQLPYSIALVQPNGKGLLYCIARKGEFESYFAVFNPETEEIDLKNNLGPAAFLLGSSFYDEFDTAYFVIIEEQFGGKDYIGIDPNSGEIKYRYSLDDGFFSNVTYDPNSGQAVGFYVDTIGNIYLSRFEPTTGNIISKVESQVSFVSACKRSFDTDRGYYIAVTMLGGDSIGSGDNAIVFLSPEDGQIKDTIFIDHQILQLVYKPKG